MPLYFLPRLTLEALCAVFIGSFCLGVSSTAQAQAPVATRSDSMQAARRGTPDYVSAQLTFTTGKRVQAFLATPAPGALPTSFLEQIYCYETSPERIPPPPLKTLDVERLREMTLNGHRYESLVLKGKPIGLLAENLAVAGPVELFGYAKTKNDMLVPIPLMPVTLFVSTGTHDKYYWYVRTRGGALLEVPRGGNDFANAMSTFFAADASVSARVQQKEKGAEFKDMVQLVNAFNSKQEVK